MESNTLLQEVKTLSKLQVRETVVILGTTLLLPFIVHLIPVSGNIPIGARLLPIFYAPLVAVILFRWHVGVIAALFAPTINYLITGSPQLEVAAILTFELTLFVGFVYLLKDIKIVRWFMGPLSYLLAKACSVLVLTFVPSLLTTGTAIDFGINSISNGFIGLILLLVLNIFVLKIQAQFKK